MKHNFLRTQFLALLNYANEMIAILWKEAGRASAPPKFEPLFEEEAPDNSNFSGGVSYSDIIFPSKSSITGVVIKNSWKNYI